jgi:hypothetical protein
MIPPPAGERRKVFLIQQEYQRIENLFKNSNDIELQIWKYDKEKRR